MNLYILDTDILQLYQDADPTVVSRARAVAPGGGLFPSSPSKSNCPVGTRSFGRQKTTSN